MEALKKYLTVPLLIALVCLGLLTAALVGLASVRGSVYNYTLSVTGSSSTPSLQYGIWPELSNKDFYTRAHAELLAQRASFVEANLSKMELAVFRDGVEVLQVPIKSKGKEGSWWETPSGLYRAEGKEKSHFSSFGRVHMPYSIPFQGNFFIHGWPYYDDGTPVSSTYSGGCIRLEDTYAAQVFELVEVGMPILVYEEASGAEPYTYALNAPALGAASYLAVDLKNNFVLLAGSPTQEVETVTVPKLLTAVVATEHENIEKPVTVRDGRLTGDPRERLTDGATYSVYDLLFPLLLEDNDAAAHALAGHFGERRFVGLLNQKASALGLAHTRVEDPSGAEGKNVTTAEDTYLLLRYLLENRRFILSMSANTISTATYGEPVFETIAPIHPLIDDERLIGGVAATSTPSGETPEQTATVALAFATTTAGTASKSRANDQISVLTQRFGGAERTVAYIVYDSPDPAADTQAMIDFVGRLYR